MNNQQIGRSGELLVQYTLLLNGIDSSPMTTDYGIDLVAFSPSKKKSMTIQIKSNLKPKPGGGKGKPTLSWWIEDNTPADLVAFVDLSTESIWLFSAKEVARFAQQHSSGRFQLYMNVELNVKVRNRRRKFVYQFERFRIHNRISHFFG